jgi:hypothetical protein
MTELTSKNTKGQTCPALGLSNVSASLVSHSNAEMTVKFAVDRGLPGSEFDYIWHNACVGCMRRKPFKNCTGISGGSNEMTAKIDEDVGRNLFKTILTENILK